MRALVIPRPGPPEVLTLEERPDPVAGPDEIVVAVGASALNRADLLQRRGLYPAPPGVAPDIPGLEFAGTVAGCGPRVALWRPGDRVMGIVAGGGHAERVVTHEQLALAVPAVLDDRQAAALPEAFLTAFDALELQAGLGAGERVLVPAAASGVGTAALQLAAAAGARAVALSRSADKRKRLAALAPSAAVLDPAAPDLARAVTDAAGGRIDVVLDLVGAALWPLYLDVLAERGRIVVVGTLSGTRVELDLGVLMRRRAHVLGTVLRTRPLGEKIALTRAFAARALPLFARGELAPVVDRVLPLAEAAAGHALLERNATFGKVVLAIA